MKVFCLCFVVFLLHFHTVCVVSLLGASAEMQFSIPVGKLFTYEVMRETFQSDFEPLSKLYRKSLNPISSLFRCCQATKYNTCCVFARQDSCTMTPWFLSATSRISQISQSGCASPKGTRMITASCTGRRHLQRKL